MQTGLDTPTAVDYDEIAAADSAFEDAATRDDEIRLLSLLKSVAIMRDAAVI